MKDKIISTFFSIVVFIWPRIAVAQQGIEPYGMRYQVNQLPPSQTPTELALSLVKSLLIPFVLFMLLFAVIVYGVRHHKKKSKINEENKSQQETDNIDDQGNL